MTIILCISDEDVPAAKKSRIIPFSGSARRLDGKPSTQSVEQTPSSTLKQQQQTANAIKSSNRASGKLVFGSNANTPKTQTQPKVSFVYNLCVAIENYLKTMVY